MSYEFADIAIALQHYENVTGFAPFGISLVT